MILYLIALTCALALLLFEQSESAGQSGAAGGVSASQIIERAHAASAPCRIEILRPARFDKTPPSEVLAGRLWSPASKQTVIYSFEGRHEQPVMPARYPKEIRKWMLHGNLLADFENPSFPATAVERYESIEAPTVIGPDSFSWKSVATAAHDHLGHVLRADGKPAEDIILPRAKPAAKSNAVVRPGGQTRTVLVATGLSFLALAVVAWIRGRGAH